MKWCNVPTEVLGNPDFIGCDPAARAAWFCVLLRSVEQENSGRILGARSWSDRRWQQWAGVTAAEVAAASPLLRFDGDDLVVELYPLAQLETYRLKCKIARENGQMPKRSFQSKERKRKGKGKEGKDIGSDIGSDIASPSEDVVFPAPLNCEEFRKSWETFIAYRRERRLPKLTRTSVEAQLRTLADWGLPAALESINNCIRNSWQGLFPPGASRSGTQPKAPVPSRPPVKVGSLIRDED